MKLVNSEIKFKVGRKNYHFNIVNNLPEAFGMSISNAFETWIDRSKQITEQAFCDYITSKGGNFIAMPKSDFDKMQEK